MSEQKTNIFISYSHKDEHSMQRMKTHLNGLRRNINIFADTDIMAGQSISQEISSNICDADIAIFLISADFLVSEPCLAEWSEAKTKGIIRIPIVIKHCNWEKLLKNDDIKTLPKDGTPVNAYSDEDSAYQEISNEIERILQEYDACFNPKKDFLKELQDTEFASQENIKLQDIFIFPNLKLVSDNEDWGEIRIKDHEDILKKCPVFIHGEQSSGKTALARHLCMYLIEKNTPVLYIDLKNKLYRRKNIDYLFEKEYSQKFSGKYSLWSRQKDKVIILDNMSSSKQDMRIVSLALDNFDKVIVLLDSDTHQAYYKDEDRLANFSIINIKQLSRVKQEELIRKRVGIFKEEFIDVRVDQIEKKVNMIILDRIVPRYPFFVLTVIQTFEGYFAPTNLDISSYASCYYVVILANLAKSGIDTKEGSIGACLNYMKNLAFYRYKSESFDIKEFNKYYREELDFMIKNSDVNRLMDKKYGIINEDGKFKLSYAYYYFLGAYLAENISVNKDLLNEICEKSFTTENNFILIFFVHHCPDKNIIDDILIRTACTLERAPVAKLTLEETNIFGSIIQEIKDDLISDSQSIPAERKKKREIQDDHERQITSDEIKAEGGMHDDIYRILKTNELLKQILHNHYGQMNRSRISEIVHTIIESGLRLVSLLLIDKEELEELVKYVKEKYPEYDESRVTQMMQWLSFFWVVTNIEKIVGSISLPDIREEVQNLIDKEDTPAYKMIGYFNHLDISENGITEDTNNHLRRLLKQHKGDPIYKKLLSIRTQDYMRTHKSRERHKQTSCSILGIEYKSRRLAKISDERNED